MQSTEVNTKNILPFQLNYREVYINLLIFQKLESADLH